MAKTFDPSSLSPSDRSAFQSWQYAAQQYLHGGALPAEISYVLMHPEYLQTHPELRDAYNTLQGVSLPPSVKSAIQSQLGGNVNFDWSGGQAGIGKHKGVWSQPETWVQIALGAAFGAAAPSALASGGGGVGGGSGASGFAAAAPTGYTAPAFHAGATAGGTAAAGGSTASWLGPAAISAGGSALSGFSESRQAGQQLDEKKREFDVTAQLENARLDPYRNQSSQAKNLALLALMQQQANKPPQQVMLPDRYAQKAGPSLSTGMDYEGGNPQLTSDLTGIASSVRSGTTASLTNPNAGTQSLSTLSPAEVARQQAAALRKQADALAQQPNQQAQALAKRLRDKAAALESGQAA